MVKLLLASVKKLLLPSKEKLLLASVVEVVQEVAELCSM